MKICRHLGGVVANNACSCGATISIFRCQLQNMNAVRDSIDFERELDRRHSSSAEKVGVKELRQILAVCEVCSLSES